MIICVTIMQVYSMHAVSGVGKAPRIPGCLWEGQPCQGQVTWPPKYPLQWVPWIALRNPQRQIFPEFLHSVWQNKHHQVPREKNKKRNIEIKKHDDVGLDEFRSSQGIAGRVGKLTRA